MSLPRIAVTMGDPAGIGPEICVRMLHDRRLARQCTPVVFGDASVMNRVAAKLGLRCAADIIRRDEWPGATGQITRPALLDLNAISADTVQPGIANRVTGAASYQYIEASLSAALAGEVDAVVTGPINKQAFGAAGLPYPGHTELFADKTNSPVACMMLASRQITCSFVTTHVGLRDVPGLLSTQRILDVIELSRDAVAQLYGDARLTVCGLNPHAGEHGLFGSGEEEQIITPAIEAARGNGFDVQGPLPPDTAFLPERRRETDCYICMYHDQGLIPLKTLAFDSAVNITLGLPVIRTSVDHGTALDIAWQGKANANNLVRAVELAVQLATSTTPTS